MSAIIYQGDSDSSPPGGYKIDHVISGSNSNRPVASNQAAAKGSPKIDHSESTGSAVSSNPWEEKNYRQLSQTEWVNFCRGVGVFKDDESEKVIRPTSSWWPPKGFRDGLYQDVLSEKTKFTYRYHFLSTVRWLLMVIQLCINAVVTALSAQENMNGTVITTIAAINTAVSGLLALMHNGGLPERYRSDRNEFTKIEEHLKSIVDSRLVPADHTVNDLLAGCFRRFREARQTVADNFPSTYTSSTAGPASAPGGTPQGAGGSAATHGGGSTPGAGSAAPLKRRLQQKVHRK